MKNRLIAAFLTFVTISSFAQQPNNAELLKKLKSEKNSLQRSKKFWTFAENTYRWWYKDDFSFPADLYQEIYEKTDNLHLSEHVNITFDRNYYRPENWKVIKSSFFGFQEVEGPIDFCVYRAEFKEGFTKHHQEYCNKNPHGRWKNLTYDDFYVRTPKLFEIAHQIIFKKNNRIDDIEEVDHKIKELEAQK